MKQHGLSLGMVRHNEQLFVTFKAVGTLTHSDYALMTPMLNSALNGIEQAQISMLADITEFDGWELRAAWDDFKLGMTLGRRFDKIAIVGHQRWQALAARLASWFISGEVKSFADTDSALAWLAS